MNDIEDTLQSDNHSFVAALVLMVLRALVGASANNDLKYALEHDPIRSLDEQTAMTHISALPTSARYSAALMAGVICHRVPAFDFAIGFTGVYSISKRNELVARNSRRAEAGIGRYGHRTRR